MLRLTRLCFLAWLVGISFGQVDIEINSGVNDATGLKMEGENGLKLEGEKKDQSMTITGLELTTEVLRFNQARRRIQLPGGGNYV